MSNLPSEVLCSFISSSPSTVSERERTLVSLTSGARHLVDEMASVNQEQCSVLHPLWQPLDSSCCLELFWFLLKLEQFKCNV